MAQCSKHGHGTAAAMERSAYLTSVAIRRPNCQGSNRRRTVSFHQLPQARPRFDVTKHYVRFREIRDDGYVLFDFAIGDPELAVELMLPLAAYQAFCRERGVIYLTREQADTIDFERSKWQFGRPGIQE